MDSLDHKFGVISKAKESNRNLDNPGPGAYYIESQKIMKIYDSKGGVIARSKSIAHSRDQSLVGPGHYGTFTGSLSKKGIKFGRAKLSKYIDQLPGPG
jgi:hypothetical protein